MESLTVMMIMTMLTMRMRMTMRASLVSFELHLSSRVVVEVPQLLLLGFPWSRSLAPGVLKIGINMIFPINHIADW